MPDKPCASTAMDVNQLRLGMMGIGRRKSLEVDGLETFTYRKDHFFEDRFQWMLNSKINAKECLKSIRINK